MKTLYENEKIFLISKIGCAQEDEKMIEEIIVNPKTYLDYFF